MEFGTDLGWYGDFEIEDAVSRLANMGWFHIDLGPVQIGEAMEKGGKERLRAFRKLCESLGVQTWQMHLSFWDAKVPPHHKDIERWMVKNVKDAEKWMKICQVLDVPYIGFHPSSREYGSLKEKEKIMQHNVDFFKKACQLAEDTGMRIVVENMPNAQKTGAQITELLEIIEAVGSPSIGICLDTSHANAMNLDVVEAIHECGSLLWATHVSDSNGAQGPHRIPFNADYYHYSKHKIDWFRVILALKTINYQSPLMLELPGEYVTPLFVRDLKLEYARKLMIWLLSQ